MTEPRKSGSLITDEIVDRAAAACDNVRFSVDWEPKWDGMPDSYKDMRRQQMRAALEAVEDEIYAAVEDRVNNPAVPR